MWHDPIDVLTDYKLYNNAIIPDIQSHVCYVPLVPVGPWARVVSRIAIWSPMLALVWNKSWIINVPTYFMYLIIIWDKLL